jgi:hypothetical protein
MATKKKTKKTANNQTRSKKRKKLRSAASPKATAKKGLAKKKSVSKKPAAKALGKTKAVAKKRTSRVKSTRAAKPPASGRSSRRTEVPFFRPESDSDSAGQSGDLQGLSNVESADSESVDELIEEGNAFEAGVVEGVEDAGDQDEREVRTREVPEDDVPGEYLDED